MPPRSRASASTTSSIAASKAAKLTEAEQDELEEKNASAASDAEDLEEEEAAAKAHHRRGKTGGSGSLPKPVLPNESAVAVVAGNGPAMLQRNTNNDGLFEPHTALTVEQHNVSIPDLFCTLSSTFSVYI